MWLDFIVFSPSSHIWLYGRLYCYTHTHTHPQMILHGFSALRNSHSTKLGLFPSLHDMSLNNVHYKHANTHPHTRRATIVFSSHPHILSFKRGLVTYCHCVWARLSVCVCVLCLLMHCTAVGYMNRPFRHVCVHMAVGGFQCQRHTRWLILSYFFFCISSFLYVDAAVIAQTPSRLTINWWEKFDKWHYKRVARLFSQFCGCFFCSRRCHTIERDLTRVWCYFRHLHLSESHVQTRTAARESDFISLPLFCFSMHLFFLLPFE